MRTALSSAAVVDRMPIACITFSPEWEIESWNPAAQRIFGWGAEEIVGRPAAVLLPEGFTRYYTDLCDQLLAGATIETQVNENIRKDGTRILCRWSNTPLIDEGNVIGILSMAEDITADHQTQNALRRSEQRHRDLVNSLPHYIFSVDNDDRYLAVNAAVCEFLGLSESEIIGKKPEEIGVSPDVARQWSEKFDRARASGTTVSIPATLIRDGRLLHLQAITTPIRDDDGAIAGVTGISIDITEQKKAETERRILDDRIAELAKMEALGTLAGGIAHDFNNVLSIILTYVSLLERRADDPASQRAIHVLKQAIDRGAGLSRQILTFARRAEIQSSRIDTANLVMELISMVSETFPRNIRLTFDFDPELPLIQADSGQLHQALLNLCINARDAMPDGGTLNFDLRVVTATMRDLLDDTRPSEHICIAVSDDGTGMEEPTRRRIFEPFFTTKEKGKGTGLGLAMVYGVVKAHGGFIDVESHPGRGTTFRLYFPACSASAPAQIRSDDSHESARGETLLLIEDEPDILEGLSLQLRDAGYNVRSARNGVEAMEIYSASRPDAVLTDLGMPSMGAVDLLRSLHEAGPDVPIVAMTGYVDPEVHAQVFAAGVKQIVKKPFEIEQLLRSLREVLTAPTQT